LPRNFKSFDGFVWGKDCSYALVLIFIQVAPPQSAKCPI